MTKRSSTRCQNQKIKHKKAKQETRHFRSTLDQLVEIAENVRAKIKKFPKHLQALKRCPFWNFYQPFHEARLDPVVLKRKQKNIALILNTFDPVKGVFKFDGGMEFESTAENLAVIFGLQKIKGAEEYTIRHPKFEIYDARLQFSNAYFKGSKDLNKRDIIDSLYATAGDVSKPDDFVKLLVLYLCVAVFFTLNGGHISSKFLNYVFAMDQVSWPDLIHSYLMKALRHTEKPYITLRGCSVYILYWFAEVTHFISKNEGEPGNSKPRFLRWNTKVLAEKIGSEGISSLKKDLTGSFIDPLDEGEQRLVTAIEIRQTNPDRIGEKMVRDRDSDGDSESSPDRYAEVIDQSKKRKNQSNKTENLSKKRKISIEEPRPCEEGNGICNYEPEHMPSSEPTMPAIPILPIQESGAKENENDVLYTSVEDSHGNDVHIGNTSSVSDVHTTGFVSHEVGELVEEPMDATSASSSAHVPPSLTGCTSVSSQEITEGFEFQGTLQIPEEYNTLYKKIYDKYGHMATRKVIKLNDAMLLARVTSLLKIISDMETVRGAEVSVALLERWEGCIREAEILEFNIKWLREGFSRLKNHWKSSFRVGSHEQVLDANRGKYYGDLLKRKEELETELSEVNIKIGKAKAEAIQEKQAKKNKFQCEPVIGIVLHELNF